MQTNVTLDWADGSYDFKLSWTGCAEVERKGEAAIQVIFERLMLGQAKLTDISEVIRQGLRGGAGGVVDGEPVECKDAVINRLIATYVIGPDAPPVTESWNVAKVIMQAAMVGYEPAQKKSEAEGEDEDQTTAST